MCSVFDGGLSTTFRDTSALARKNLPRRDGKLRPEEHKRRCSGQRNGGASLYSQDILTDRWSLGGLRRMTDLFTKMTLQGAGVLRWAAGLGELYQRRQLTAELCLGQFLL